MNPNWLSWCRLCAKSAGSETELFCNLELSEKASIITNHLNINVSKIMLNTWFDNRNKILFFSNYLSANTI